VGVLGAAPADVVGRLVKAGTIPSQQPFPPVSRDGVPFDAPEGWAWCQVADCFAVAGGIQKSGKRRPGSNAFPYLRVANVQRGTTVRTPGPRWTPPCEPGG